MQFEPEELIEAYDGSADYVELYDDSKREAVTVEDWPRTLDQLKALAGPDSARDLFDVGAADGRFLDSARSAGFTPHGNELSAAAIATAQARYGIDLFKGDLSELSTSGDQDAVTMWCVLAHVHDGEQLLRDVHRTLRTGGVLFIQTPRWSAMDSIALWLLEVTRGRMSRIVDRRTPGHHLRFHTAKSATMQLNRLGYDVVSAEPKARYSMQTEGYLDSIGLGPRAVRFFARPVDALLARGWFFRIVLDVYARKR